MYEVCIVRINLPLCVDCMCGVWNYYSYNCIKGFNIFNSSETNCQKNAIGCNEDKKEHGKNVDLTKFFEILSSQHRNYTQSSS